MGDHDYDGLDLLDLMKKASKIVNISYTYPT